MGPPSWWIQVGPTPRSSDDGDGERTSPPLPCLQVIACPQSPVLGFHQHLDPSHLTFPAGSHSSHCCWVAGKFPFFPSSYSQWWASCNLGLRGLCLFTPSGSNWILDKAQSCTTSLWSRLNLGSTATQQLFLQRGLFSCGFVPVCVCFVTVHLIHYLFFFLVFAPSWPDAAPFGFFFGLCLCARVCVDSSLIVVIPWPHGRASRA